MKSFLIILIIFILMSSCCADNHARKRTRRAAYDLADGWYYLIDSVKPSFSCFADGYYADVDNGCQIYHVCHTIQTDYGRSRMMQYSFICGNNTIFDQLTLTCNHVENSIPCESSPDFYYLNSGIGDPEVNFLYDEDVEQGSRLISNYRFGDRKMPQTVPQIDVGVQYSTQLENQDNDHVDS